MADARHGCTEARDRWSGREGAGGRGGGPGGRRGDGDDEWENQSGGTARPGDVSLPNGFPDRTNDSPKARATGVSSSKDGSFPRVSCCCCALARGRCCVCACEEGRRGALVFTSSRRRLRGGNARRASSRPRAGAARAEGVDPPPPPRWGGGARRCGNLGHGRNRGPPSARRRPRTPVDARQGRGEPMTEATGRGGRGGRAAAASQSSKPSTDGSRGVPADLGRPLSTALGRPGRLRTSVHDRKNPLPFLARTTVGRLEASASPARARAPFFRRRRRAHIAASHTHSHHTTSALDRHHHHHPHQQQQQPKRHAARRVLERGAQGSERLSLLLRFASCTPSREQQQTSAHAHTMEQLKKLQQLSLVSRVTTGA